MKQRSTKPDCRLHRDDAQQLLQNKPQVRQGLLAGFALLLVVALSIGGCKKDSQQAETPEWLGDESLPAQTVEELTQAHAATARYETIDNAFADGYEDINVVRPNMGYHFLKAALVDITFDPAKPEILVYNKNHDGDLKLVALEYAVPISLRPNAAPEGFTGNADVWKYDTEFGLWLLHAWVWEHNPAGVFNPTNPAIHVH